MPAPRTPNTTNATAARIRAGQDSAARKLSESGWICFPPEHVSDQIRQLAISANQADRQAG